MRRQVGLVLLIEGAIFMAAGATLAILNWGEPSGPSVSISPSLGGVNFAGSF